MKSTRQCYHILTSPLNGTKYQRAAFVENESYFKKEIRNIPIEHGLYTIDHIRFYLKYSAPDNLKIREEEDNVHEIEPNTPKNRYTMIIRTIKKI
jgi:hypothetical protein